MPLRIFTTWLRRRALTAGKTINYRILKRYQLDHAMIKVARRIKTQYAT
jgi:hypothetical protein